MKAMNQHSGRSTISVLLTGTSYPRNDQAWQGRFIADMVNALSCCRTVSLRTWLPPGNLPSNVTTAALPEESRFLEKLTKEGGVAHIIRSKKYTGLFWLLKLLKYLRAVYQRESQADVMHVNWLQNTIPLWGNHTPALVTVLGTDYKLLDVPGMVPLLRMVMKQRKTIIAPNAHWMKISLEKQFGDIARIRTIPFGVQRRWFDVCRQSPGQGGNQWLTVSRLAANKIGPLFEWGKGLFDEKNILCLLGPNQENLTVPDWVVYRGATYPDELAEKWFPSAAGLITLSRHDEGRPQVILEAMAAGIPVIASDMAAHRDVVIHKKTGWIVTVPEDLKQAIDFMNVPENNRRMGEEAKSWVKEHIGTWEDCARRYETAYADLTGKTL
jgi:glycosyltransferase involved in cell wall biosynthesis